MTFTNIFTQDDIIYISYVEPRLRMSDSILKQVMEVFWTSRFINKVVLVKKSKEGIFRSKKIVMDKEDFLPKQVFTDGILNGRK